jgi:Starch-binding associating with outer membrane
MKKLSVLIVITIVSTIFWGCSKNYLDINTPNPNLATNVTPELIITNAMTTTAAIQVASGAQPMTFLNGWMGIWAPSGSYAQNSDDVASYKETTNYGNILWGYDYHNLEDYYTVEQSSILQVKPFYEAMAKVMKAYVFQQLVDMFGNVPYSNAFQGTIAITPKYDSAQNIYLDIASQCDSAVALMNSPSAIGAVSSDIMFGGNNQLWIQFANTLKLRILMRQTQMPGQGAYITAEIAKIVNNAGGFLTQDAVLGTVPKGMQFANNSGQQSPVWGYFRTITGQPTSGGQADYWRASSYGINVLQSNADPRLPFIYSPDQSGVTYTGSVLGSPNNPPGQGTSSLGTGLLVSASQPAVLMSAAESNFLQAEAIARGYMSGDDAAAYSAGVQASFNFLGAGDATAYLIQNNPNSNYSLATTTQAKIAVIVRQKWIAENGVTPFEIWADYRRLGLPADIPLSISPYKAGNTVPVRLLYPVSEYTTNTANVNAQGNIDYNTTKIFWNQ